MALGLILPVQLGMVAARTLGTHFHGRALTRGAAGTVFEQGFDFVAICLIAIGSAVTWFSNGEALTWVICALAITALALLAAGQFIRLIRWLAAYAGKHPWAARSRIGAALRSISEPRNSGLLNAGLARRLIVLSMLRFGVVILMMGQTASAMRMNIPLWHLAAAAPFVFLAGILAITPGALGVNELTASAALKMFGTPLAVAAQWSLANRILSTASYFIIAICAGAVVGASAAIASSNRSAAAKVIRRELD